MHGFDEAGTRFSAHDLIAVERIDANRFHGRQNCGNGAGAIFGGQLLGLALSAAQQQSPPWPAHSLTGYFVRSGQVDVPVEFAVERVSDQARFATRRVIARQHGRPIFDLLCSLHDPEPGPDYESATGAFPQGPHDLLNLAGVARVHAARIPSGSRAYYTRPFPIEMRMVDPEAGLCGPTPRRDYWFRMPAASTVEDGIRHQCLLAMMSDFWLPSAARSLHALDQPHTGLMLVSLNHSFWFHRPARADSWLLYRTEIQWAGDGRGLARGTIYDESHRRIASASQEFLMRRN